ncbi:MAG TPA: hypothetical protein VEJ63_15365 [Planctomycetota bacterium]|nr:hypothetical protein [Planctomycetota bacterium]
MPSRSRHKFLRRSLRIPLSDARQLARQHPDAVARNLLHLPRNLKNHEQRREVWRLLKDLASDSVLRRASETIERSRIAEELEAVLQAAIDDGWMELRGAIARRLHREIKHLKSHTPDQNRLSVLRALAEAAGRLNAPLSSDDVRALLKHSSSRLRMAGAQLALREHRSELLNDVLPLCWERSEAAGFAGELVAAAGKAEHAGVLWSHALSARRAERCNVVRQLVDTLGEMGAFDIQIALRVWIEEDFTHPEACAWCYAKPWSRLVSAKLNASACTRAEALEDLQWFERVAGQDTNCGFGGYGAERGPFYIARLYVQLGEPARAESLLKRYVSCGLPPPTEFPELLFPSLKDLLPEQSGGETTAWLAALGDSAAQEKLIESWLRNFAEARRPEYWDVRKFLDSETVLAVLRQSLRTREPGVLRQILGLLMGDPSVLALRPEIERLAQKHASTVVRWKARRLLRSMRDGATEFRQDVQPQRAFVRMDAAVLSGAMRAARVARPAPPRKPAEKIGILPPEHPGSGYRLVFDTLSPAARRATELALCKNALHQALDRRVPRGPAFEDRPDLRAVRELAPPQNEIDERMAEMAEAVMSYWSDGDDVLTLDEEGIALVATGLCADVRVLDEDDVLACGAFVGEALRKRLGGEWSGYDDQYLLQVGGETLDPIGWVRDVYNRKDVVEGTQALINAFQTAVNRFAPRPARKHYHPDPSKAIEAAIHRLNEFPPDTNMTELLSEARVLSYRLEPSEWEKLLAAMDPLMGDSTGVRTLAAIAIYSPSDAFARAWARWGRKRREESGLLEAVASAMIAAAERDDLEAMPDWTAQPQQSRYSFLNPLRKSMDAHAWQKVLLLLLRQRAIAGDRSGVAWCLYSYKYEFSDALTLIHLFCDMSVSARQTVLRATFHATRDEKRLFRPLWAEALRDPSDAVVMAALSAVALHQARSLRPMVDALTREPREQVAAAAADLLRAWEP